MASLIPNAEFCLIETAGHLSNIEQPAIFNRAIARFLKR
jgi:pimeloyl-ACP methyl ester carboxylesterase